MQGAIGYAQYFTGVPPLLVTLHIAGSIVVWVAVLRFQLSLTAHPLEAADRGPRPTRANPAATDADPEPAVTA
jgi:cytochrome c oxidase assembly protein subunit 15